MLVIVVMMVMVTMLVAIFAVHWPNGWAAIADSSSQDVFSSAVVPEQLQAARTVMAKRAGSERLTVASKKVSMCPIVSSPLAR